MKASNMIWRDLQSLTKGEHGLPSLLQWMISGEFDEILKKQQKRWLCWREGRVFLYLLWMELNQLCR
ncbi:hypothetical protein D3C81_1883530 [compost metagenome]